MDINTFGHNSFVHTKGLKERIEMTEHLFKLKEDGKTVGYLKIAGGLVCWRHTTLSAAMNETWYTVHNSARIDFDTAHPFVTKDKNDKDVFEGDRIYIFNSKADCRVIWSATHRGWAAQLSENPKGLPMSFVSFYPRDIELIEDEDNDSTQ